VDRPYGRGERLGFVHWTNPASSQVAGREKMPKLDWMSWIVGFWLSLWK